MGSTPSHLNDQSDQAFRDREEALAQVRRQKVQDAIKQTRKKLQQDKLQRRVEKIHRAEGVPDGWGIPDLGYAKNHDGPYKQYPWSV